VVGFVVDVVGMGSFSSAWSFVFATFGGFGLDFLRKGPIKNT
jgi:hypothetical protein